MAQLPAETSIQTTLDRVRKTMIVTADTEKPQVPILQRSPKTGTLANEDSGLLAAGRCPRMRQRAKPSAYQSRRIGTGNDSGAG